MAWVGVDPSEVFLLTTEWQKSIIWDWVGLLLDFKKIEFDADPRQQQKTLYFLKLPYLSFPKKGTHQYEEYLSLAEFFRHGCLLGWEIGDIYDLDLSIETTDLMVSLHDCFMLAQEYSSVDFDTAWGDCFWQNFLVLTNGAVFPHDILHYNAMDLEGVIINGVLRPSCARHMLPVLV